MNYNKYQFSKVNDKKVLHKVKKQWVVISLAILMALGGGAAVGYTAHADTTVPTVKVNSANSGGQASQKSQNITNQAHALHSSILINSSDQNNNSSKNDYQDNKELSTKGDQLGNLITKNGYEEYPNDKLLTSKQHVHLSVYYYDDNTLCYHPHHNNYYKGSITREDFWNTFNSEGPNIIKKIPTVPTNLDNKYQYNGKYTGNKYGSIKNSSDSTISYIINSYFPTTSIKIYLTRVNTINVNYVDSNTGKVVYDQDAGPKPSGTPFDYKKFEGLETFNYLPKGYQLDKSAHDYYDENPMNYLWYANSDQIYTVYVKPEPFSSPIVNSVINVNYVDSKTGKVVYDQDAGREPDGTPFDYKKFEEQTPFDYLPKGYQLDNSARDGWNLNQVHYPYYTNHDQIDIVYVKQPSQLIRNNQIMIEYKDTDNNDKIIAKKNVGSEPDGSSFNIKSYENNLPKNYQLNNSAHDGWNLNPIYYPYYTNISQSDYIYVKHQMVPINRHVTNILTVNYRYQNGNPIPGIPSKTEQITYAQAGIKDKVTGQTSYSGSWNVINGGWPSITSPNFSNQGYEPDKAVINEVPSYNSGNKIETVVYHKTPARPYDTTSSVNRSVINTLTINYRDQDGHPIPGVPSKTEQITYAQSGIKDMVTGQISYSGSWYVTNGGWPSIPSPDLQNRGYSKPSRAVINDVPSYNSGNKTETVIYHRIPTYNKPVRPRDKTSSINRSVTYTLTINYRDQNGNLIPGVASKSQSVSYTEYGTKDDKTGNITWHNDWDKHRSGEWSPILSPDLTSLGYCKPSRQVVDDVTPDYGGGDKIENVYYSKNVQHHSQVPSTPITPVPKPNNPITPNPVPKPSITPEVPKIPSQPKNTPQLPASKPSHDYTVIHPNNDVTPTSKHVKRRKLIKRYRHHRRSYQKWIPRLIANHKNNIKYPSSYKANKRITHHFSILTYHHYDDHKSSPSKFELPQTNEFNGYHKTWSIVLMSFAMIITAFGLAMDVTKHHVK